MNVRASLRVSVGECLERREMLTSSLDLEPSSSWLQQLAVFEEKSLAEVAPECIAGCESLTLVHSYDGAGNNPDESMWGATHQPLRRDTSYDYADGVASPGGVERANPRDISNHVALEGESSLSQKGLSNLVWVWGQFVDHDITFTPTNPDEPFNIPIPAGDPMFDPEGTGALVMPFVRSAAAEGTGESVGNPRQQINTITAYLDGSVVYGSDTARADGLRSFSGGRLKTTEPEDLLPYNVAGLPNEGGPNPNLFLAGDVRANENVALTAMHTIWVREHNRLADCLSEEYSDWNDEQIYQYARAIVTAELQAITYNEFLPALLGPDAISPYGGYDPEVDPTIRSLFAGATYRFGHSMLPESMMRMDAQQQEMPEGPMPLRGAFFAPYAVTPESIDTVMQGAAHQLARDIDNQLVEDVRSFMFGPPGAGGFDLAALNIQRGRDQGLASYNQVRRDLGLEPAGDFSDVTSDPVAARALGDVYSSVEDVDAWVGMLAEDHLPGAAVGELIYTSLVKQFEWIRNGDRFWYENRFEGGLLEDLRNTTLKDVIERNTGAANLQANVFLATETLLGDLNDDFVVDRADLVALTAAVESGSELTRFDLNQDGRVDGQDSSMLAMDLLGWIPGDANGDGLFSPADLIQVFQAGQYEDGVPGNSSWFDGDFNGDREFDTQDLILAFQTGRYVRDEAGGTMAQQAEHPGIRIRAADLTAAIDVVLGQDDDSGAAKATLS